MHNSVASALIVAGSILLPVAAEQVMTGKFLRTDQKRQLVLANGGKAMFVIVADPKSTSVKFAAAELKQHLELISGATFQVVEDVPEEAPSIVLGNCAAAREVGIEVSKIARDGYLIQMVGQRIFIAGRDDTSEMSKVLEGVTKPFGRKPGRYAMERFLGAATWDFERGTLYGVYRFLEELGVRWFLPGQKGLIVPTRPILDFQAFSLHEEPAFLLRNVGQATWQWYQLSGERIRRMVNVQEYEDLDWDGNALRLWLLRMRHSSEWFAFNHRPPRTQMEERYSKQHPEYFAMRPSGERDLQPLPGRTGHLCYTEPGVLEVTKNDIRDYFAGKTGKEMGFTDHVQALNVHNRGWSASAAYGRTVSLLPHDSFRGCECPDCLGITHKDAPQPRWHSELVWQFVEKAASWMQVEFPDKLLTCLAYSSYSEKPASLKRLPDNVVVGMCPARYARTSNVVAEENYQDLFRMVREWSSVNDRPMLIWLHHLYRYRNERRRGVPMLLTSLFSRLVKDLSEHANLATIEFDTDSIILEHLNRYVLLKLLYNPHLDAKTMVEDYARSFYGPAGEVALTLLQDIERRSLEVARTNANSIDTWEKFFSKDVLKDYRAKADRMLELTRGTPREESARLFSTYFIGAMEEGYRRYVRDVKDVAESKSAKTSIRQLVGKIEVDGDLSEEGWARSSRGHFINNVDGNPSVWKTEIRMLRATEHLYFAFICPDPNTRTLSEKKGEADTVELFLDPEHDHDSYYFIQIDIAGRLTYEMYFEGGGEPPDKTWKSNATCAVKRFEDRWIVEIALPRKVIKDGLVRPVGRPWGANFGRSAARPPKPEDRFTCWSPLIRGKFHQPDLFGHIFFVK